MIQRVYIETDTMFAEDVKTLLATTGITVTDEPSEEQGYPVRLAADVPDSRDAVDEVTDKLNYAGIMAYVYE